MTVVGFHGDPCLDCLAQHRHDPGWHVQRATHGGDLCPRHFLAASPATRNVIRLGERDPGGVPFVPFVGYVDVDWGDFDAWRGEAA